MTALAETILTNTSIHLALLGYTVGLLAACLGRHHRPWQSAARAVWTTGCVLFLVHVAAAFHFHYGWSHAVALRETARQTEELTGTASGAGLYLNYLFTLIWIVDAAAWWRGLERYRARPVVLDVLLHGFFVFMAFNATIVFEEGWIRWSAVAVLLGVIALLAVFPGCVPGRGLATAPRGGRVVTPGRRVAYVTAGTAGMFCGSCLSDNALAGALQAAGRDVVLVPTFTPLTTESTDMSIDRVFLGGINLYLAEHWPWWRRLPAALCRPFDHPRLLRILSALALESRGDGDAALAISLMRGTDGRQRREIEELVRWLADDLRPDLVHVSNLLVAGFVPLLKARRDIPVLVTLQGDELFLDDVRRSEREDILAEMRRLARTVDGFVVMSRFYRDFMVDLLGLPAERFHIVPLGVANPEDFSPAEPDASRGKTLAVGYLARIYPGKGLHILVDAFLELRRSGFPDLRLEIGGWLGRADRGYLEAERRKLERAGAADAFSFRELPDRASKAAFLRGLDVFSVPVTYPEHTGLYALEALAAGVPVVLPDAGVFPEMLGETGGGRLVPSGDAAALAAALRVLLGDETERRRLGEEGRRGVLAGRGAQVMAEYTWTVYERFFST